MHLRMTVHSFSTAKVVFSFFIYFRPPLIGWRKFLLTNFLIVFKFTLNKPQLTPFKMYLGGEKMSGKTQKTREQILRGILELVGMIPDFKDSPFPDILNVMVSKEFIDTGKPAGSDMVIVGKELTDYQKALATLKDSTRLRSNSIAETLVGVVVSDELPDPVKRTYQITLTDLECMYTQYCGLSKAALYRTHGEHLIEGSGALERIEGFRVAIKTTTNNDGYYNCNCSHSQPDATQDQGAQNAIPEGIKDIIE